ncbi:MAG: tRNA (adenosine(37)-N6)-threonylcarbamoyltransferase complex transferase subunit TsaD [Alphaproteobacteria bacterium]|nr:tRNA (adenosine(37)-N6)-threonylcarbamoyltransferase complex transferase subunit TsaD [Alphaproteobacteria bacterium]
MKILGIETSCDETAAAVVTTQGNTAPTIAANCLLSQVDDHQLYGGVVPEIAARAHLERLDGLIAHTMDQAGLGYADLDGVAATAGPGLIGGVLVGVMTAKAIAAVHDLAFIAVNHLEAHALTARLVEPLDFPYLLLLVSGGHCQILVARGVGDYQRLGGTLDDAAGEAFDKVAKLLGLAQPGGPSVERIAAIGDPERFALPRPLRGRAGCDFSFSGLKTAVRHLVVEKLGDAPSDRDKADIAAAFQTAVADIVADRLGHACRMVADLQLAPLPLVVAGGVAANGQLRARLANVADQAAEIDRLVVPPPELCTDNGAMVAWAGHENLVLGRVSGLDMEPRPRWPLTDAAGR